MIFLEHTTAIELRHITKRFGSNVVANDDISLEIKRGEILSLLGENGSGKTTLMNMLSGIYFPDGGQIFLGDREVILEVMESFPCDAMIGCGESADGKMCGRLPARSPRMHGRC